MASANAILQARTAAGLSQTQLAALANTKRSAISAYENDRKSPRQDTLERLLNACSRKLSTDPAPKSIKSKPHRGRRYTAVRNMPRLSTAAALATVELPRHLYWSHPLRPFNLSNRDDRRNVYEIVLREGTAKDICKYVDPTLLTELWDDMYLPSAAREVWQPIIDEMRNSLA